MKNLTIEEKKIIYKALQEQQTLQGKKHYMLGYSKRTKGQREELETTIRNLQNLKKKFETEKEIEENGN